MNIATMFTFSRILVAPFFAVFFITAHNEHKPVWLAGALIAAILIELSDMFDGMIARSRKEVTDFGKIFDPVADSVSRQTVFLSFLVTGVIPLWMYLVFFYRDAFVQLLRIVCASTGVVLAARISGKVKAIVQAIATFAVLLAEYCVLADVSSVPAEIAGHSLSFWAVFGAALVTFYSFFDYVIPNRASIMKMLERK